MSPLRRAESSQVDRLGYSTKLDGGLVGDGAAEGAAGEVEGDLGSARFALAQGPRPALQAHYPQELLVARRGQKSVLVTFTTWPSFD